MVIFAYCSGYALLWWVIMLDVVGYYARCGGIFCVLWWVIMLVVIVIFAYCGGYALLWWLIMLVVVNWLFGRPSGSR